MNNIDRNHRYYRHQQSDMNRPRLLFNHSPRCLLGLSFPGFQLIWYSACK